jgi:hypothetical protein
MRRVGGDPAQISMLPVVPAIPLFRIMTTDHSRPGKVGRPVTDRSSSAQFVVTSAMLYGDTAVGSNGGSAEGGAISTNFSGSIEIQHSMIVANWAAAGGIGGQGLSGDGGE